MTNPTPSQEHEENIWLEFYMKFNDNSLNHAYNAFDSLRDTSAEALYNENKNWIAEIRNHGLTDEEILKIMPKAKDYM